MNVIHPDQLLRAWKEHSLAVTQQVTIYSLANPVTAVAASAKSGGTSKNFGKFCFGCNRAHDPTRCFIVAAQPQYRRGYQAKRTAQDGYTLLIPPGFALLFNNSNKNIDNQRDRGGRNNRAVVAAAQYDTTSATESARCLRCWTWTESYPLITKCANLMNTLKTNDKNSLPLLTPPPLLKAMASNTQNHDQITIYLYLIQAI